MNNQKNEKTTLSTQDARSGRELGVMRDVLYFSLVLAIVAGVCVFTFVSH
jgi:hypothetical protein